MEQSVGGSSRTSVREWGLTALLVSLGLTAGFLVWLDQTAWAIAVMAVLLAIALRPNRGEEALAWSLRAVLGALLLMVVTADILGAELLSDALLVCTSVGIFLSEPLERRLRRCAAGRDGKSVTSSDR
ncbi:MULTISPECIES: hypothetical protein [Aeromicrobium]|uniref:Uncharacterized protein n=1 Tax=Aeromicrobium phoceense TaxID=2754045 RepID=A0A838XFR6_9ACTN|nr:MULTISPECIES: hypothetical protein [Aeromicrobium]MBA4607771.1 hypothetical protein [Aeromicrobium phoceense]